VDKRNPERLAWLRKNREVWEGRRLDGRTVKAIHGMMQVAGLYKFTTCWYFSEMNIRKLIWQIRNPRTPWKKTYISINV